MKRMILMLALCATVYHYANAQEDTRQFDQVVKEELPVENTGATVLVSRNGKIIYKKALGNANAELNVPMQMDNVFRIASITKQFTAIAILQLMEQGKLNLQDEITRFLPDYPMQGAKITIEHLLTHTSGIRDYSSIKDSVQRGKMDFTPVQMIAYFQNQPMRFAPGAKYEYSNSNYFLLGYIIEKITGKTYQQYLEHNFFRPLGMNGSSYASDTKIIQKRAAGYTTSEQGLINAEAMSMTQPYAAGSILSTAEDLFKWNQALQSYKLVKKETLERAFTRHKLPNGKEISYGYGFRSGLIQESTSIWHGGLINGFMTMAMYLPKEDVYVVVLSNCNCISPERATAKLAALAIGKPYAYKLISVPTNILQTYAGVYENEAGDQLSVSLADTALFLQRGRGPKVKLNAIKNDRFIFDDPLMSVAFGAGKLTVHTRTGNEVWNRSNKVIGDVEIKVDEKILEMYAGLYEVSPQFSFTITKEKDRLFLQASGQDKFEMFAAADNKFFLKVNDAQFEFINEKGKITKVILKQGGRTTEAAKVK